MSRAARIVLGIAVALAIPVGFLWAVGFELNESKGELQLDYEVSIYDHDTGRVTIEFTLKDEGRLKPITSVDLYIPAEEKTADGGTRSDLTVSMALRPDGTNQVARAHLRKDWAERAEIWILTGQLDGKKQIAGWYYHPIPLKDLVARAKVFEKVK